MDPTNSQIPNPSSGVNPEPVAPPVPEAPQSAASETPIEPANSVTSGDVAMTAAPTATTAAQAAPIAPVVSPNPVNPTTPVTPAAPVASSTPVSAPVSPAAPATPVTAGGMQNSQTVPVNPIIRPNQNPIAPQGGIGAMDAILRPEPTPLPDPVEEELKAPMKAAAPVPGSIGSAVSGPSSDISNNLPTGGVSMDAKTPSVSFNDPAVTNDKPNAAGKKTSKKTLIALIVVALMVVIALAAILVMQLLTSPTAPSPSGNSSSSSNSSNNSNSSVDTNTNSGNAEANDSSATSSDVETLSCTRNMTAEELINHSDAVSGSFAISAEFNNATDLLSKVSLVRSIVYADEHATENEPVSTDVEEAEAENITSESAANYFLPVNSDGTVDLTLNGIRARYQELDFTCEEL